MVEGRGEGERVLLVSWVTTGGDRAGRGGDRGDIESVCCVFV